jgi:hypothetical protein
LLRGMEKLKGRPEKASDATRLSDLGISYDQSSQGQKLAAVLDSVLDRRSATIGVYADDNRVRGRCLTEKPRGGDNPYSRGHGDGNSVTPRPVQGKEYRKLSRRAAVG